MSYYDEIKNVMEYIRMTADFDGGSLINRLKQFLNPGASLLELGMGEGKDLDILKRDYKVTGSDTSKAFIYLYRKKCL